MLRTIGSRKTNNKGETVKGRTTAECVQMLRNIMKRKYFMERKQRAWRMGRAPRGPPYYRLQNLLAFHQDDGQPLSPAFNFSIRCCCFVLRYIEIHKIFDMAAKFDWLRNRDGK